jgi:hypothetical protein
MVLCGPTMLFGALNSTFSAMNYAKNAMKIAGNAMKSCTFIKSRKV